MKITGNSIIDALIRIVCVGLIFWLLKFLLDYLALPQPFNKIANVILIIGAVLYLINELRNISSSSGGKES
jgi:hypothetical protein